jgi:hypothetical protein
MSKWTLDFYADTPRGEKNKRFSFRLPYSGPSTLEASKIGTKRAAYFSSKGFKILKWYVNSHSKAI